MGKNKSHLSKRIVAGLIDYFLVFAYIIIMMQFFGIPNDEGGNSLEGLPALSVVFIWFLLNIGIEQMFGATIGNQINDLKPIYINGTNDEKINLSQSLKRHLLDILDMFFFGLVGIILIKNTENHQRLGDLWAKTKVISTK